MKKNPASNQRDWQRFERAVDVALKTPAKHKTAIRKKKKSAKQKA